MYPIVNFIINSYFILQETVLKITRATTFKIILIALQSLSKIKNVDLLFEIL